MSQVAEHHRKQKWECDNGVRRRIHFAVAGHAVRVDQHLKSFCEFVCPIVGWRILERVHAIQDRRHR